MLAKSLLVPIIAYGCEICCCVKAITKIRLNVAFNNIIRYVYALKRYDHVSAYAKNILGCSLDQYLKFCTIKCLHRIITSKQPSYLFNKLIFAQSNRSLTLVLPRYYYLCTERQFFVYAIRIWNALPLSIRRSCFANSFDHTLFRHMAAN